MARFLIQWCAPDATNEEYTKAIVDYIKGGKPMDEYPGFKVLARLDIKHIKRSNKACLGSHSIIRCLGLE